MSNRTRVLLVSGLSLLLILVAAGYVIVVGRRSTVAAAAAVAVNASPGNEILFRSTRADSYGRVAELDRATGGRKTSSVSCTRVYAAAGSVICLRPDGPLTTYQLAIMDARLHVKQTYPMVGVPNRARVSPSGNVLAWTVFVAGDSYNGGKFSTRAGMMNIATGAQVGTLETFKIFVDGKPYQSVDLNFWGVTFADDDHFYATMSTHNKRYLVKGDIAAQTVSTLAVNVECPSLSPDQKRIAFKEAIDGNPAKGWRLTVLDLATMQRTHLAETRSVDDQAAWSGNDTVMYAIHRGKSSDIWTVPADGTGTPTLLIPDGESPAALY